MLVSIASAQTLVDLLHQQSDAFAQQGYAFLQDGTTVSDRLTYAGLHQRSMAIAATLQATAQVSDRAILLFPPGLDFIAAFFGCLYAGVIAVPAYPPRRNQNLERLMTVLQDAQATIALSTAAIQAEIAIAWDDYPELSQLRWIAVDAIAVERDWQRPKLEENTIAFLQYTSGSTGNPKGVMVSHGNLLHNSKLIQQSFGDTAESVGVSWLPPYHDMGLIGGILQPLYVGASTHLMSPMMFLQKPLRWLSAISHFQATTSGAPNFAYELLLRKVTPEQRQSLDLSQWQVAFTGAEPIQAETLDRFSQTFADCGFQSTAWHPCYGMAETTLIVSGGQRLNPPLVQPINPIALEQNRIAVGSRPVVGCGQPLADLSVAIVNPYTLTPCTVDQVGEIWVSGPSVAQGYWNQPEATVEAFQAKLGGRSFLRTGDLGFFQHGELFITGRLKDVIIIRGQNHYPQDLERTAEGSDPSLRQGANAAITLPASPQDYLVIVQEVERTALNHFSVEQVAGQICQAIAAEHALQVDAIAFIKPSSIPKTSSGKIQRRACRDKLIHQDLNLVGLWSRKSVQLTTVET